MTRASASVPVQAKTDGPASFWGPGCRWLLGPRWLFCMRPEEMKAAKAAGRISQPLFSWLPSLSFWPGPCAWGMLCARPCPHLCVCVLASRAAAAPSCPPAPFLPSSSRCCWRAWRRPRCQPPPVPASPAASCVAPRRALEPALTPPRARAHPRALTARAGQRPTVVRLRCSSPLCPLPQTLSLSRRPLP